MSESPIGLADLIRQHQDRTGDSYAILARASGLSKAKIGQLALTTQPHMPRTETLRKLADALQLPWPVVQSAAMVSAGVSPETSGEAQRIDLLVAHLNELPEDDLEVVEVFVDALLRRRRG